MICGGGENESGRNRKLLLGIGYFVQGLRCFPVMGMSFFLKDGLRVQPSILQMLQFSTNLPMVAKPLYGILSDSFYILGQHRMPYLAFGAFLQAMSWMAITIFASSGISVLSITFYLLLGGLGASLTEVANDAMVAETSSKTSSSGLLQPFVWMALSTGGVLGNLLGGVAVDKFSPPKMFFIFATLVSLQFFVTLSIRESSLDLPKTPHVGFKQQFSDLLVALKKQKILYLLIWIAFSFAVVPALTGSIFYYQTQHLKIEPSLIGISKVFAQAAMLLWGVVYNRHLKSISSRKLIAAVQVSMAVFSVSDFLFVKGVYRGVGLPDSLYVVVFSGLNEVISSFKILPFDVLMAQLCPPGCEGSVMAFATSTITLAFIVSGYLGVALASCVGVSGDDFSGLPRSLLIQAACALLPVFWASCIPAEVKSIEQQSEAEIAVLGQSTLTVNYLTGNLMD